MSWLHTRKGAGVPTRLSSAPTQQYYRSGRRVWIMLCPAEQSRRPSMNHLRSVRWMLAALLLVSLGGVTRAQQYPDHMFQGLRWRLIGPHRGGRTRAATGVPSQPNVFYMGQVHGGVWKSDDYGRTWKPILDDQPTQSIGAIPVAPSDPKILYVARRDGFLRLAP